MNPSYKKGVRNEYRSMRLLESVGYFCIRSAGSHSPFDIVGISRGGIALVQCKSGAWPTPAELETIRAIPVPDHTTKFIHRWDHRATLPVVKEIGSET